MGGGGGGGGGGGRCGCASTRACTTHTRTRVHAHAHTHVTHPLAQVEEEDAEFVEEFLSRADPSILHFLVASGACWAQQGTRRG